MLPARNGLVRSSSTSTHICLSCRLQSQRRLRHDSTLDLENTIGFRGLEQGDASSNTPKQSSLDPQRHRSTHGDGDGVGEEVGTLQDANADDGEGASRIKRTQDVQSSEDRDRYRGERIRKSLDERRESLQASGPRDDDGFSGASMWRKKSTHGSRHARAQANLSRDFRLGRHVASREYRLHEMKARKVTKGGRGVRYTNSHPEGPPVQHQRNNRGLNLSPLARYDNPRNIWRAHVSSHSSPPPQAEPEFDDIARPYHTLTKQYGVSYAIKVAEQALEELLDLHAEKVQRSADEAFVETEETAEVDELTHSAMMLEEHALPKAAEEMVTFRPLAASNPEVPTVHPSNSAAAETERTQHLQGRSRERIEQPSTTERIQSEIKSLQQCLAQLQDESALVELKRSNQAASSEPAIDSSSGPADLESLNDVLQSRLQERVMERTITAHINVAVPGGGEGSITDATALPEQSSVDFLRDALQSRVQDRVLERATAVHSNAAMSAGGEGNNADSTALPEKLGVEQQLETAPALNESAEEADAVGSSNSHEEADTIPLVRKTVSTSPPPVRTYTSPGRTIAAHLGTRTWQRNAPLHASTLPTYAHGHSSQQARAYHISRAAQQQAAAAAETPQPSLDFVNMVPRKLEHPHGIRAQLRKWQELHGNEDNLNDKVGLDTDADTGEATNNLTRLPDEKTAFTNTQAESEEDEREAMAHFMQAPSDEPSSSEINTRFLNMGDLVEIEFTKNEREPLVAVFIRRTGLLAQFYTMQGRWVHMQEKKVQYAIPGWVSKETVEPLLQHLPTPEEVESDLETLMDEAYIKDLSVPRSVAAPLVSRMVQFHGEAQEIYRRHASTLDNAHNMLAHETDLRYGSLVSAATTLLKMPADKLPVTALYAVRQALAHAGFAFNIDRRSHRLTGYLQIRSKEQVKMVEQVRRWLRDWQDDLAITSTMDEQQLKRHRASRGAQYVYGFLEKAKTIVERSRQDREPTHSNIGPSKVKLPITPDSDCVRITKSEEFTEQDTELVRFVEAWSLSQMFQGLPRVEALPPLLLQATGLYEDYPLTVSTGMVFLQELGTVMPYENRIRFDQHLLLPSSQHSKPLQNLMTSLIEMADKHNFVDSMADLRYDWGKMPVYCIDDASAHEIDDGISIETAATASDGVKEWWVHIHIANPTAFFSRDHPLAKMARHMGESIYMPERTYMMLPRWSTQRHFSLGRDRPCLTFSARMDRDGNTLERKIRSGTIKNVFKITPQEVRKLLGVSEDEEFPETVLTVGGDPPAARSRKSQIEDVSPAMVRELRALQMLSEKRADLRRVAGGLFFDTHKPDVNVWQSYKAPGLAWDHPHRRGSRLVEGDPVIQMRTRGMRNWFSPFNDTVGTLVREFMLLACEVAATWCGERQIPAVFRGSIPRPDRMNSSRFFEEVLAPAAQRTEKGDYPMHLGMRYLETFGNTVLSTKPFKHKILGMDNYGKVTSPLRRYGDMIVHWQIEAALREEARIGKPLITSDHKADRRFLPFSTPVLNTILVGLQPRESIIMKAKMYAENFWMMMLLFRAHHFHETPLPFARAPEDSSKMLVHAYIHTPTNHHLSQGCMVIELNVTASMRRPELVGGVGGAGGAARQGDVWECEVDNVDVFRRIMFLNPRRLVERVED